MIPKNQPLYLSSSGLDFSKSNLSASSSENSRFFKLFGYTFWEVHEEYKKKFQIKGRRTKALNEYKERSEPFRGLSSFGGPQDSFRKDALSIQRVKEIINNRMDKIGLGGLIFGEAGMTGASAAAPFLIIGVGITSAGAIIAASFAFAFGAVLLPFIGIGIAIGGAEGIGRIAKRVWIKKEDQNIANLDKIKDETTLVKHWEELKQGDRCFLLGKMASKDKGFETEYTALEGANVLNEKDKKYFKGATFIENYATTHALTEEEKKQFYYFRKQSISSDFLQKKDFKVLLSLHEADPDSTPIKIALYRKIITATTPDEQRNLFFGLPKSAADQLPKLSEESRKTLFNQSLSSIMKDTKLKEDDLTHFFEIVPFLTKDLYKDAAVKTSDSLLTAKRILDQNFATSEIRLTEIKKIIPQIQEAIKEKTS